VEHSFLTIWRRYSRVLKQRNAALRQSNVMVVESLDPQLIQLGEQLHQNREKHVVVLNEILQKKLPLFNKTLDGITLSYRKGWSGDSFTEAIQAASQRDMEKGSTGPGPHKADLYFSLDGVAARDRLSRGEQKAMTAAMMMAQAQLIGDAGEKPVLLLDDLSSELDGEHLDNVLQAGLDLGSQILLTGTDLTRITTSCESPYAMFHVEHGSVTPTDS
jgi:DNA replication and repair protein RecF